MDALNHWIVVIEPIGSAEQIRGIGTLQQVVDPAEAIGALGEQIGIEVINLRQITTRCALIRWKRWKVAAAGSR